MLTFVIFRFHISVKELNILVKNSVFKFLMSFQPDGLNILYFKLRLFELTEFIV